MIPSVEIDDEAAIAEGFEGGAEVMKEAAEDRAGTGGSPTSAVSPRSTRRDC